MRLWGRPALRRRFIDRALFSSKVGYELIQIAEPVPVAKAQTRPFEGEPPARTSHDTQIPLSYPLLTLYRRSVWTDGDLQALRFFGLFVPLVCKDADRHEEHADHQIKNVVVDHASLRSSRLVTPNDLSLPPYRNAAAARPPSRRL